MCECLCCVLRVCIVLLLCARCVCVCVWAWCDEWAVARVRWPAVWVGVLCATGCACVCLSRACAVCLVCVRCVRVWVRGGVCATCGVWLVWSCCL